MTTKKPFYKTQVATLVSVAIVVSVGTALVTGLLVSIFEKKQEGKNPFFRVVEITNETEDPAIWGKNFPDQYEAYLKTADQVRTRYGGSEAVPRTPTQSDPRSVVARSKLEQDPRLKTMWAGYAFSRDFRERRGHAYMLLDQKYTERQLFAPQPGTCLNCHASLYVPWMKLGNGDLFKGFERLNQMSYPEAVKHAKYPISCIDCHDPKNMQLRVTRPAFMEGIRAFKQSVGVKNYDVNTMASRQEMRSYVCGQCHVEYYFKGSEKRLTFPWNNGLKVEQILAYYDENGFRDWVHKETQAPALKAQHPEFEMWNQGIHAASGVTCVDCHMPYKRAGAMKISDHHVQSPVLNLGPACQTCHPRSEEELKIRVETIQNRQFEVRNRALDALMALISDLKKSSQDKNPTPAVIQARQFQRKAQFLLDFAEAENSMGFHAPQEAARIMALSIDYSRQGQASLRD